VSGDEQPIPWVVDSGDGEVVVGAEHGPEPAPTRVVTFKSPDGKVAQQIVSEEAWQKLEELKKAGYVQIATTSRKEQRAMRAQQKRAARRASRQGGRPAS